MKRRSFLQMSLALAGLSYIPGSCTRKKVIKGKIIGASAHIGHMLHEKSIGQPEITEQHKVVIIGGGVSGLSAARHLQQQGLQDFIVLDLEANMGGNAAFGQNEISAYPWGAHYVPTPNNSLIEYLDFLKENGVITGFDKEGLPIYNELYLCFDPQERLYLNGRWQEGLVPHYGVPDADRKQIEAFLQLMNDFRHKKGTDGREAFTIPADESSTDETFTSLDSLTMKEWLLQQGFTSDYLHWYVNYCTRDDYGTTYDVVSAWAGIHYYASRKGRGANSQHYDVLTWPEGNGWLVQQLQHPLKNNLRNHAMVMRVAEKSTGVQVDYYDVKAGKLKSINAVQVIMAVPQFIAARLLGDPTRIGMVHQQFQYTPWMVSNLKVSKLEERSGSPLSWDNVLYGSSSLGYVNATHELLGSTIKKNLTYYLPLTGKSPVEERKMAQHKTHAEWLNLIIEDLKIIHPNIEEAIEEANIMIWGHAMIRPVPGIMSGSARKELGSSINNKIHFAHTDLSGISIFEEAFYQGIKAAKKVLLS